MKQITWMHPSYRDLVIEELQSDLWLRSIFLETASIEGIQLALSDSGGPQGKLHNPLLLDNDSWKILSQRCIQIASNSNFSEGFTLLNLLNKVYVFEVSNNAKDLEFQLIKKIVEVLLNLCNEKKVELTNFQLKTYCDASLFLSPLPQIPNLIYTWTNHNNRFHSALTSSNLVDFDAIEEWINLIWIIIRNEPRFFRQIMFPANNLSDIQKMINLLNNEVYIENSNLTIEDLEGFDEHYSRLSDIIREFSLLVEPLRDELIELADNLLNICDEIRIKIKAIPNIDQDEDMDILHSEMTDEIDVKMLFNDL